MKFILKFSVLWIKCLQKHVGVSIFHCNLLELFQVFSNWINWKPKIYNRWKGLKSNLPEIFTLWVQSNHSQIPLKSTEHFSHRNPTKKKRSALIFFQCSPTVWDTQEIWRAQQSYRMMELQLSDTFFSVSGRHGWLQSAGQHWIKGHFLSNQDEFQPLAFTLVRLWCF